MMKAAFQGKQSALGESDRRLQFSLNFPLKTEIYLA